MIDGIFVLNDIEFLKRLILDTSLYFIKLVKRRNKIEIIEISIDFNIEYFVLISFCTGGPGGSMS